MSISEEVRANCAEIAATARSVRIDEAGLDTLFADGAPPAEPPPPDPQVHYLEGKRQDVATFVLTLDAINFGSGWFPTLRKAQRDGRVLSGYTTVASAVTSRFRADGPWDSEELRAMTTTEIASVLGQPPDHELMALYAQALRELGRFLGDRSALDLVAAAGGSAEALAESVARGMTLFCDRGFYKRAQILASDLAACGVSEFSDLDQLTIFADNLVPHVLRCHGALVYDDDLGGRIDAGELIPVGRHEREIRGCAVHACEILSRRVGVPPRTIDTLLWTLGQSPEYKSRPRHRTRCVYY